jgi:hypothetical protein
VMCGGVSCEGRVESKARSNTNESECAACEGAVRHNRWCVVEIRMRTVWRKSRDPTAMRVQSSAMFVVGVKRCATCDGAVRHGVGGGGGGD